MSSRTAVLLLTVGLIGLLAGLTVKVTLDDGLTPLVVLSLLIVALLGVGAIGALTAPPPEE